MFKSWNANGSSSWAYELLAKGFGQNIKDNMFPPPLDKKENGGDACAQQDSERGIWEFENQISLGSKKEIMFFFFLLELRAR